MKKTFTIPALVFLISLLFFSGCTKEPLASISADKTLVEVNEQVTFINNTTNGVSWLWNFGDNATSTEQSPKHSFSAPGDYTVMLTAYSNREKKSSTHEVIIRVTGYAYKFTGFYSGISNYQSPGCGSGSASNNIQVSAALNNDTFYLYNLDNKFQTLRGVVNGPSTLQYILPQTGIYANDGTRWDLDTVRLISSGNSLIVLYSMTDAPYANTCGYYGSTLQFQK